MLFEGRIASLLSENKRLRNANHTISLEGIRGSDDRDVHPAISTRFADICQVRWLGIFDT